MDYLVKGRHHFLSLLLILITLLPVLMNKYFPSEDGPVHVHSAYAYLNYDNPDTPIFKEYYEKNSNPEPNILVYGILSFLMLLFNPPIAEKILIVIYIIFIFLSFKYLLSRIPNNKGYILFLFPPFILNYPIHLGFYNFSFSIILFFIAFGYWVKNYQTLNWINVFVLVIYTVLMYFFHPVSTILFYIASAAMSLWYLFLFSKYYRCNTIIREGYSKISSLFLLKYLLSILPTILLLLFYFKRQGDTSYFSFNHYFKIRIFDFVTLSSLYSFSSYELVLSTILSSILFILSVFKLAARIRFPGKFKNSDSLLFISLMFFLIYLIAPDNLAGGGMLTCRLLLFPFFMLLLWLADFDVAIWVRNLILSLSILLIILYSLIYSYKYKEINTQITDYISCSELIPSNSVILHLTGNQEVIDHHGTIISKRVASFLNIGSRISYYKPVVDLSNYMAWTGYGILDFKPELDPNIYLHDKGNPYYRSSKKILEYPTMTGGRIDYVILWNYKYYSDNYTSILDKVFGRNLNTNELTINNVRTQLNLGFNLTYVSQSGLLELYRKNP